MSPHGLMGQFVSPDVVWFQLGLCYLRQRSRVLLDGLSKLRVGFQRGVYCAARFV